MNYPVIVEGQVRLQDTDCTTSNAQSQIPLNVYVFDRAGKFLQRDRVEQEGSFSLALKLEQPQDIELFVAPTKEDPKNIRKSTAYSQKFTAKDWIREDQGFRLQPKIELPLAIWQPWMPRFVCVSGRVRKQFEEDGQNRSCPVPFVKVEIFDVDREPCWLPYLKLREDLLRDRVTFPIPELIKKPPFPPDISLDNPTFSTQKSPTIEPSLPSLEMAAPSVKSFSADVATPLETQPTNLENLTLTSKIAPWQFFPLCFYSKDLVCETTTDADGFFRCCFRWFPLEFRRGRFRFDAKPDIVVRITQVIDGVETVIYADPYSSTRWNQTNAFIDLALDNPAIQCGESSTSERPKDKTDVFFTRIGDDEVYQINQTTGLYGNGSLSNVAYGSTLLVYAQFGENLANGVPVNGKLAKYYRLSYAKQGSADSDFKPITTTLNDTRVDQNTLFSETHNLGPKTVNLQPALYELRDFANYYWYNPDKIGSWATQLAEDDTGIYILRLELFDSNGDKLTASDIGYRDGTVPPENTLPLTGSDRCDLFITLDNKLPELTINTPATNTCGVIPWNSSLNLNFNVRVSQENNRLYWWRLRYSKGVSSDFDLVDSNSFDSSTSGNLSPVNEDINGNQLLNNLTSTCAFALELEALPHIRNGRGFIYRREEIVAIAIEKC
ncbi:hypothetical protein [Geitlerinema sp. PCC 9228]|uniref:hypothetical protein n=1 Tax=Geitlerinema sp. PCC 9228 TaxID=111611 RepID=UPI0008F9AE16|nr:hypothetical protein [Geitlerinema sp. PCC 9228]